MPALRNEERKKSECINGVIFNMSPAPIYQHSVINGNIFTIYYLKDGKYVLEESYIVDDDEKSEYYNLKQEITLRKFPITMTLEEIFLI